jgi:hypothetical protein
VFWFVPYIWIAYADMVGEAEKRCDGSVVNQGIRGTEYANHLVDIVHSSRGHILLPYSYPNIGRRHMLRKRIQYVLGLKVNQAGNRTRIVGILLLICFCCILPLLAVTCATKPYVATADEPLYGTWVNEEYASLGHHHKDWKNVKYVLDPAGRLFRYESVTAADPIVEARLTYHEKWTDRQGNVYYKAEYTSRWYPYDENPDFIPKSHWYVVYRVNAAGNVLESVWNQAKYAEEFSHLAGWYEIHYRQ